MNSFQRLSRLLYFSAFIILLSTICIDATEIYSSEDQLPLTDDYKFHRRPAHGISDPGSPWITGPKNKKYQFHVGRQSWLAAREHCLGQNSDLVTISSAEELEWILGHYSPQYPNLKDRLVQIGLLIDTNYGTREWRWVNKTPLKHDILSWVTGEPFDHADGRERCAILRVNNKNIDDVDCDLPGSMTMMYRFVCERTHEEHVKHEEVNNPLWKKLQDILDFFGISGGQEETSGEKNSTKSGENDEDYWEMSKENATTPSNIEENKTETEEIAVKSKNEDIEGSGVEVDKIEETPSPSSSVFPPQAQGTKTLDNALISDELIVNENLAKINEKSAEIKPTTATGDILLETASIETTRTTKADPLEKISSNNYDKTRLENEYVDVLERNMEKLEKIVSAVEKMIDPMEEEFAAPKPKIVKDGIVKKENKHKQEEELKPPTRDIQANESLNDGNNNTTTTTNIENEIIEAKENEKDTVDAMENDFDEAEHETQSHPNVNSGDLVVVTPEHQKNIELCENEEEEKRNEKIEKFLKTLHRFLNRSSAKDLKELVEESKQNGTSLLERLNQSISKATEKQIDKMEKIQKTLNESSNANDDDGEKNPKKSRENDISKISVIPVNGVKGHSKIQFSSMENNNNNEKSTEESTPSMSTTFSTTPEKAAATSDEENEKTSETETSTPENNEIKSDDKEEIKSSNENAKIDSEKDEKNSSSVEADLKEESTKKSEENVEANSIENKEEDKNEKDEEEDKSHEVKLTIHLPKDEEKTDNFKEESAMNNDVEENNKSLEEEKIENNTTEASKNEEEKDEEEKSNEVKEKEIVPKSRADRLPSAKSDGSVFPTPRFDLLKPEELKKIPDDINRALEKEAKKISKIYDDFNKRIDTASLIKQIEESEKRRLEALKPLPIVTLPPPSPPPKITLAPSHDEAERKAMRELEKLFEDLGKNFQQIVQG